jgi:tetratricopeptide (TPR) repeat protein
MGGASATRVESLKSMGDANLREGRFRAAMQNYMEADGLNPKDAELKYRIALVYSMYFNKMDEAIPYYQESIRLKKDYSEAHNGLGAVYLRQQRWDEAIPLFKKAIENMYYPTPELAYVNLGRAYQGKRDYPNALNSYERAIEMRPQDPVAYWELGLLYQEMDQHGPAANAFQQARSLLEKREPKRGRISEAEWDSYRASLAGLCFHQGLSLRKVGRTADAREAYQRALEMSPDDQMRKKVQEELQSLPPP